MPGLEQFAQYGILGLVLFTIGLGLFWGISNTAKFLAPLITDVVEAHRTFVTNCDKALTKMGDSVEVIDKRLTTLETIANKQTSILTRLSCNSQNGKPLNDA